MDLYIGPLAKEILQVLVPRLDRRAGIKGAPIVEKMCTYEAGRWKKLPPNISVLPLYVDHSALDAYMLYLDVAGKKILFTGDFRTHGIQSERGQLWAALKHYVVPGGVDVLLTEGTMLSRLEEAGENPVKTERDLGRAALEKFFPLDGSRDAQLIYSMWTGYLHGPHKDKELIKALGGREPVPLHTSGHAYIDAIAQLIETVKPKVIVPMHTECADKPSDLPSRLDSC